MGPHLRVALPAEEARAWLGTIVLEGLAPLVAFVGIEVVRRNRRR
ncbi:hypothetical protein [Sorangium sp. So ce1182]